jgi:hypothetical protein
MQEMMRCNWEDVRGLLRYHGATENRKRNLSRLSAQVDTLTPPSPHAGFYFSAWAVFFAFIDSVVDFYTPASEEDQ